MHRDYAYTKDDEILSRRDKVWQMRVDGHTVREIADAIKMSVGTVHGDLNAVRAELDENNKFRAEAERAIGASRLDKVAKSLLNVIANTPFDKDGNIDGGTIATVANAIARVEERRAKLLGLDAATKTELTGAEGGPLKIDARDALLHKLASLATGADTEGPTTSDTGPTDAG
jgi:DNA-binding CsgD family transcriptional regulator